MRRSQAERGRTTRAKIVDGVIAAIQEHGVAGLRCRHISAAFGLSWGAAQYQFVDKSELLLRVASEAVGRLSRQLQESAAYGDATLYERVERIVHSIWAVYSDPAYHALVEIVRGVRAEPRMHEQVVQLFVNFSADIERHWAESLANEPVSKARSLICCNIVVLTVSGLASRRIYLRRESHTRPVLDQLVTTITNALERG